MAYRYYAVRHGKTVGVVSSWAECKEMVDGIKGAEFKGFNDEDSALEYLKTGKVTFDKSAVVDKPTEDAVNIYARGLESCGSFDIGVVVEGSERAHNFFGRIDAVDYASLGSIAAELLSVMVGVQLARDMGFKCLNIVFAYDGVEKWYDGSWAAKGSLQSDYAALLNNLRLAYDLSISFKKMSGKKGAPGVVLANKLVTRASNDRQYIDVDKILRGTIVVADVPLYSISKGLTV